MFYANRMKLIRSIFYILIVCLSSTAFAQNSDRKVIKEVKVLSKTIDKEGNTVTKVQYTTGNIIYTTTTITPPPFKFSIQNARINPDTMNNDSVIVLVNKSKYLVSVYYKRREIRQYRAVFGPDRLDDKMQEGDRKTPEGWFKVVAKKNHSTWERFILLDYPNATSYERFKERKAKGLIPQNASIGNSVGIHGIFKSGAQMIDLGIGWTDGCISLKPDDIIDLYRFVEPGTRVYIRR